MAITIDDIRASSDRVAAVAATLDDAAIASPSSLPGWTVGHVLSHLALNAEAFVRVADDLSAGRAAVMYPEGFAARNADIDAGSRRDASQIAAHLVTSNELFARRWSVPVPDGPCSPVPDGPAFAGADCLPRRLREVEVHGVDTGLAALSFASWSDAFVEGDLATEWATVRRRIDGDLDVVDEHGVRWTYGQASAGPTVLDRRTLLAWLLDRTQIAAFPNLLAWGDQARWRP